MLIYCILKKDSDTDLIVAETGFSILAFALGPIWAFFKQLWLYSAIGALFFICCSIILKTYNLSEFVFIFSLASSFFWGKFARDLYIQNLISKKFKPLKHINANSKESAIIQYLTEENK